MDAKVRQQHRAAKTEAGAPLDLAVTAGEGQDVESAEDSDVGAMKATLGSSVRID